MRHGFGFHDRHSPFRFDPATLFIGGAIEGAFYNPSNITTLFQDDAGTTPVTAVEQTVGRILDLSGNANHATQSVLASRPTYRARYNQIIYSQQFNRGEWQNAAPNVPTVVDNTTDTTDPIGGNTAAKVTAATGGTGSHLRQFVSPALNGANTISFFVKAGNSTQSRIRLFDAGFATVANALINWSGTLISSLSSVTGSASYSSEGNGWYRVTIVTASLSSASLLPAFYPDSFAGTGFVYLWGGSLLTAADVTTTGNTYQRVAAATSYDTSSPVWRPYLAFDGSNDSMLTGSIDFTSTNKMTVWAGVTKSSDAAQGVVAELSATIASNNGAFLLSAPNSAAANYNWSSKGTTQVDNTVTTYAAPNTAVLTGQANIAGPSNIIRVNGAQAGSVATTQGTGNFGNYPLYIGRRNNATLPFNGRLYGLIVLGAAASDWQVYVTEQWMAGKTGLQF